mgnify:CR=1 FL=1
MTKDKDIIYKMTLENDNTIKTFFERFYVIAKNNEFLTEENKKFLEAFSCELVDDKVKEGKDGFLVFRGKKPKKLNETQCKEIRESNLTQMELSKLYGVSVGTINKVKNNKY